MHTYGNGPLFVRILICEDLRTLLKPVKAARGTPPQEDSKASPKAKSKAKAKSAGRKPKAEQSHVDAEKPRKRKRKSEWGHGLMFHSYDHPFSFSRVN